MENAKNIIFHDWKKNTASAQLCLGHSQSSFMCSTIGDFNGTKVYIYIYTIRDRNSITNRKFEYARVLFEKIFKFVCPGVFREHFKVQDY